MFSRNKLRNVCRCLAILLLPCGAAPAISLGRRLDLEPSCLSMQTFWMNAHIDQNKSYRLTYSKCSYLTHKRQHCPANSQVLCILIINTWLFGSCSTKNTTFLPNVPSSVRSLQRFIYVRNNACVRLSERILVLQQYIAAEMLQSDPLDEARSPKMCDPWSPSPIPETRSPLPILRSLIPADFN